MERWESFGIGDWGLYQDKELGAFTEDPIRLVHFMRMGKKDRCADLGTGNGIIPLYAAALHGGKWTGLDICKEQLLLCRASAERNGADMEFIEGDVAEAPALLGRGCFDIVTCNPPYYTGEEACINENRTRCRHGQGPEAFIQAAFSLLNNGGKLYICYKAKNLCPLLYLLRENRLEPKRMELVCSKGRGELVLLEAKKLAKTGMDIFVSDRET